MDWTGGRLQLMDQIVRERLVSEHGLHIFGEFITSKWKARGAKRN